MKKNLVVLFVFLFILDNFAFANTATDNESTKDLDTETENRLQKILDKDTLTREEFKTIFRDLMLKDLMKHDAKGTFLTLVDKIAEKVPDTFARADLEKYLDVESFMSMIQSVIGYPKDDM
jgi:hypothetical protein